MPKCRAKLRFHEARCGELGRITLMALLVNEADTAATPVIPALQNAVVLFMRDGVMRIGRFEFRDGGQFRQAWDARVS